MIRFTLGNVGHTESFCSSQFLGINKSFSYQCSRGKISKLQHSGLIPFINFTEDNISGVDMRDYCNDPWADYHVSHLEWVRECSSQYLDIDALNQDFSDKCEGKDQCDLNLSQYTLESEIKREDMEVQCLSDFANVYI